MPNVNANNAYSPFANPWGIAQKQFNDAPAAYKQAGLLTGYKNNPQSAGASPSGPYAHGNGGLFSVPGQQPQIFSAMMLPMMGLLDDLPIMYDGLGQQFDGGDQGFGGMSSPLHTYITGVQSGALDSVANQPTAQCAVGPEGGLLTAATVTMPYGKYRASFSMNLEQIATLRDRADATYLQLMNMAPPQINLVPGMLGQQAGNNILLNEFSKRAFTTAVSWKRFLAGRTFLGNPTNSSTSNNWQDIMGFDLQINTGTHKDVFTGASVAALDSYLVDMGSKVVNVGANGSAVYSQMDMAYRFVWFNASRQGLLPCTWKWVMRPELFDELTKVWPVEQFTESLLAINAFTNGRVVIDGKQTLDLRDAMREGSYLPIRGVPIEVIQDDTLPETNVTNNSALLAGQYASEVYLMPYTVLGNMPITYIQPFNWANGIMDQVVQDGRLLHTFTTDGGMFRWYVYYQGPCVQWDIVTRFRLRTHMPQLGARIQNIGYAPIAHTRTWDTASPYFANGGRTNIAQSSFYTEWSASTTVPTVIP